MLLPPPLLGMLNTKSLCGKDVLLFILLGHPFKNCDNHLRFLKDDLSYENLFHDYDYLLSTKMYFIVLALGKSTKFSCKPATET